MDVQIQTRRVSVIPTIDTSAYAADDQLGGIQTLTALCGRGGRGTTIQNITVLDKAAQEAPMVLFFFNQLPTVASSDNGALTISDAEMEKCVGTILVAVGDYQSVAGSSIATVKPSAACLGLRSEEDSGNIYVVAKITNSATYGSASDLIFSYIVQQDY